MKSHIERRHNAENTPKAPEQEYEESKAPLDSTSGPKYVFESEPKTI